MELRPTRLCRSRFCPLFYVFNLPFHIFLCYAKIVFFGATFSADFFYCIFAKYILMSSQIIVSKYLIHFSACDTSLFPTHMKFNHGLFDDKFTCVFQDDGYKLHWGILFDQSFTTTS